MIENWRSVWFVWIDRFSNNCYWSMYNESYKFLKFCILHLYLYPLYRSSKNALYLCMLPKETMQCEFCYVWRFLTQSSLRCSLRIAVFQARFTQCNLFFTVRATRTEANYTKPGCSAAEQQWLTLKEAQVVWSVQWWRQNTVTWYCCGCVTGQPSSERQNIHIELTSTRRHNQVPVYGSCFNTNVFEMLFES